ncbi:hypothetical protein AB6A40_011516 [Gnathostoma spinigerum]|uniref:Secreted protein n=1 Tax=Gnathostoma spinigerum TaxID=75299 RepID=A0ABD6F022_9BILA
MIMLWGRCNRIFQTLAAAYCVILILGAVIRAVQLFISLISVESKHTVPIRCRVRACMDFYCGASAPNKL